MTIFLCLIFCVLGFLAGMLYTKRSVRKAIQEADIHRDEKFFIRDVLGIPPH
jgi:hypothetical protein